MFFTVTTKKPPKKNALFDPSYGYGYSKDDDEDRSYLPNSDGMSFTCTQTDEMISVEYYKAHRYYQIENIDTLWKNITEAIDDNGLIISKKVMLEKDSIFTLDLVVTDTNSTRGIKIRKILKEGTLYSISANIDTTAIESDFVKTFYSTFTPKDSIIEESIFNNKELLTAYTS